MIYYMPSAVVENSINYYSLLHLFEYSVLALLKVIKIWHFWVISIGWEILELFLPYNWARESWSNKLFDLGFNFSGFFLTRRFFKKL